MLNLKRHLQNDRKHSAEMQHLSVLLAQKKKGLSKATSNLRHPLWASTKKKMALGRRENNHQAKKTTSKIVSNQILKYYGNRATGHFTAILL